MAASRRAHRTPDVRASSPPSWPNQGDDVPMANEINGVRKLVASTTLRLGRLAELRTDPGRRPRSPPQAKARRTARTSRSRAPTSCAHCSTPVSSTSCGCWSTPCRRRARQAAVRRGRRELFRCAIGFLAVACPGVQYLAVPAAPAARLAEVVKEVRMELATVAPVHATQHVEARPLAPGDEPVWQDLKKPRPPLADTLNRLGHRRVWWRGASSTCCA